MNFKNIKYAILSVLSALLLISCVKEEPDYSEKDYGYVQFKLYKKASYTKADASEDEKILQYLADATKIQVELTYGKSVIRQALVLHSSDAQSSEF